ncbi:glycosyltransferase family 4 protein [Pararobbsia silviterrae]|uniref:Glycosyltransferase family 1 protein n=1 Tax=Pararobbsia silviterrae TaxID=1792498 RepID=A0A494X4P3_9BURK|nr:glycosyltransferase family 4 protein [Pararobbsia silviterrae]RKP45312.1 glycosyltransferase family 1 protein [Pararobbsia silviterrae]
MRILHLANHTDTLGSGAVNAMIDLACAQADDGHHVTVASSGGHYEALLAAHRVSHVRLVQRKNVFALPAMLSRFRLVVSRERPQVVHAHMLTGAVLARLAAVRGEYVLIVTVHGEYQKSSRAMGDGDLLVAPTLTVAQPLIARGIPAERVRVIPTGTVGSLRYEGAPEPAALQHPNIVSVAKVVERKGVFDVLHAFEKVLDKVPDAHWYLVGDGADRMRMIEAVSAPAFAGRVHLEGFVRDPRSYLASADVFVSGAVSDTWSVVLNEAREAGCAIVAARAPGAMAALDEANAGWLVQPGDATAMAHVVTTLFDDPALREAWAQRARQGLERLSVARMHAAYLEIYRESLAARAAHANDARFEPKRHREQL